MAGISYDTLITQIRNYTEVDSNVLTTDILENIKKDLNNVRAKCIRIKNTN